MKLSEEEKKILQSVENGEWKQIPDFEHKAEQFRQAAHATLKKDKRVNIRMTERDLVRLRKKAMQEGLPYQTLISSVLHKYINRRLTEKMS